METKGLEVVSYLLEDTDEEYQSWFLLNTYGQIKWNQVYGNNYPLPAKKRIVENLQMARKILMKLEKSLD